MDKKKILLVNLSKGRTGELNSKLLGMIFVMKFQAAAMSRASIPENDRTDFALYVDEFQNFSTDSFASILSEARKYRLNLIVANQFTTQLTDEIRDAVFGNVGTIISFRVGTADAEFLSKQFAPIFDVDDLQRVPNYNMIVRLLIDGIPTQPFSMAGIPPLGTPNKELGDALKQLSAAKHGKPRAVVEKEIMARISSPTSSSPDTAKPNFGRNFTAGGQAQPPQPPKPSTGSSFLDDWLQKKQTNSFKAPSSPFKNPPANQQVTSQSPTQLSSQATQPIQQPQPQSHTQTTQPQIQSTAQNYSEPPESPIQPQAVSTASSVPNTVASPTESPDASPPNHQPDVNSQSEPQSPDHKPKFSEDTHLSTSEPQDHTVDLR